MSVTLIKRMFETVDERQFEHLKDFFTPDVIYERPGYERMRGFAALESFYRHVRIVDVGTHELWRIVVDEKWAACWGRFSGRSLHGEPLDERFADVYEIREGRISYRTTYFYRAAI